MNKPKRIAIYPGTFDPVTNGHLDILKRASKIFDKVILAVVEKPSKKALFSSSERVHLLKKSLQSVRPACPVSIEPFSGLLVRFAKNRGAHSIVRGLRAISDFDYEFQMALMNRHQDSDIETFFLMPDEKYVYLSSSMVKTIGKLKGDLRYFLPSPVLKALKKKQGKNQKHLLK